MTRCVQFKAVFLGPSAWEGGSRRPSRKTTQHINVSAVKTACLYSRTFEHRDLTSKLARIWQMHFCSPRCVRRPAGLHVTLMFASRVASNIVSTTNRQWGGQSFHASPGEDNARKETKKALYPPRGLNFTMIINVWKGRGMKGCIVPDLHEWTNRFKKIKEDITFTLAGYRLDMVCERLILSLFHSEPHWIFAPFPAHYLFVRVKGYHALRDTRTT